MKAPITDFQAAKAIERIVIVRLIARAKALPHVPNCPTRHGEEQACTCPSAVIADWLEQEKLA